MGMIAFKRLREQMAAAQAAATAPSVQSEQQEAPADKPRRITRKKAQEED